MLWEASISFVLPVFPKAAKQSPFHSDTSVKGHSLISIMSKDKESGSIGSAIPYQCRCIDLQLREKTSDALFRGSALPVFLAADETSNGTCACVQQASTMCQPAATPEPGPHACKSAWVDTVGMLRWIFFFLWSFTDVGFYLCIPVLGRSRSRIL